MPGATAHADRRRSRRPSRCPGPSRRPRRPRRRASACRRRRRARRTRTRRPAASTPVGAGCAGDRPCVARPLRPSLPMSRSDPFIDARLPPRGEQREVWCGMAVRGLAGRPRMRQGCVDNPQSSDCRGICHEPPRRLAARPRGRRAGRPRLAGHAGQHARRRRAHRRGATADLAGACCRTSCRCPRRRSCWSRAHAARIAAVLAGVDPRLIVVVGPCSIHDHDQALEYARGLRGWPTNCRTNC